MCFMSGEVTEVVWAIPVCYICSKKPSDTAFHRWSLMKDGTPVQNPALAMYSAHGQNRSGHLDLRHLSEYTMPYLLRGWCSGHASVTYPHYTLYAWRTTAPKTAKRMAPRTYSKSHTRVCGIFTSISYAICIILSGE